MSKTKTSFLSIIAILILILIILTNINIFFKISELHSSLITALKPLEEIKKIQNEIITDLKPIKSIEKSQNEILDIFKPFKEMANPGQEGLEIGVKAPEFTLPNIKGKTISLNDFNKNKILLVFSSVNCPPCKRIYPILKEFNDKYKDINLVMICDGYIEDLLQLESKEGLNFPILMWNNLVANDYLAYSTPLFYLIDEKGIIINKGSVSTLEQVEEFARFKKWYI